MFTKIRKNRFTRIRRRSSKVRIRFLRIRIGLQG